MKNSDNSENVQTMDMVGSLGIESIRGIGDDELKKILAENVLTVSDMQKINPLFLYEKVKIPVCKLIEYRDKAATMLNLRLDREIVDILSKKDFSIQESLEMDPKKIEKIAGRESVKKTVFLKNLSKLSTCLNDQARESCKIDIFRGGAESQDPEEQWAGGAGLEDKKKRFEILLSNNKVAQLVERMLEGWIVELTPRWQLETELGYVYPEAEEIVDKNNKVVEAKLRELYEAGVLDRHFFDKVFRCPFCGFPSVLLRYSCTRCGSRNIRQEDMIQHYKCGHVDLARRFKTGDKLICPQCAAELESLGKDYLKPGVMFECQNCGDISGSVHKKMFCYTCNNLIEKDKEVLEDVWVYKISNENRTLLLEVLKPRQRIREILQDKGYSLDSTRIINGKLQGASRTLHYFDVYAEKADNTMLIEVVSDENQVEIGSMYELLAKAVDAEVDEAVLFAFPKASQAVRDFALHYNVSVIEAADLYQAVQNFEQVIKVSGERHLKV